MARHSRWESIPISAQRQLDVPGGGRRVSKPASGHLSDLYRVVEPYASKADRVGLACVGELSGKRDDAFVGADIAQSFSLFSRYQLHSAERRVHQWHVFHTPKYGYAAAVEPGESGRGKRHRKDVRICLRRNAELQRYASFGPAPDKSRCGRH